MRGKGLSGKKFFLVDHIMNKDLKKTWRADESSLLTTNILTAGEYVLQKSSTMLTTIVLA
jgi:hypothetical protein